MLYQPMEGKEFGTVPIWCMGSGAVWVSAGQHSFTVAMVYA